MKRLHVSEFADTVGVPPDCKVARRVQVRDARVVVVDLRGEKLEDALRGLRRGSEERGWQQFGGWGKDGFVGH